MGHSRESELGWRTLARGWQPSDHQGDLPGCCCVLRGGVPAESRGPEVPGRAVGSRCNAGAGGRRRNGPGSSGAMGAAGGLTKIVLENLAGGSGWWVVGREGFEPPQLSRVVYSHLSSPMPSRPTGARPKRPEADGYGTCSRRSRPRDHRMAPWREATHDTSSRSWSASTSSITWTAGWAPPPHP